MLPIILVLLGAQCVFGAPSSVLLNAVNIDEISPPVDNGRLVNSGVTERVFELIDGGGLGVYQLTTQAVVNDLANQPDLRSQALAVSQALAIAGESAVGVAGDACASAALVDAVVSGNQGAVRSALRNYLSVLISNINTLVQLAVNPAGLRGVSGPKGNCVGGGRLFQFESLWEDLIASSNPYQIGLINEQYCSARRLQTSNAVRSNNLAAAISAASTGPVQSIIAAALGPVANLLRVAGSGADPSAAASVAVNAVVRAAGPLL